MTPNQAGENLVRMLAMARRPVNEHRRRRPLGPDEQGDTAFVEYFPSIFNLKAETSLNFRRCLSDLAYR
jgi:hypothetical protein